MWTVSMTRTSPPWYDSISECVRAPPPKKRTPRRSSPSVTPVAQKTTLSPEASSFVVYTRSASSTSTPMPRAGPGHRHRDRRGEVPVADELDARPRRPDLGDQLLVPRPLKDHHGDVPHLAAKPFGDRLECRG